MKYTICIPGEQATNIANIICKGKCYKKILNHGKVIAQLEPVLYDLVDVSYVDQKNINTVLKILRKIGFDNMMCELYFDHTHGCISELEFICAIKL